MDNYKPFKVTFRNMDDTDVDIERQSDEGRIYVAIGDIDICINQREDGEGVTIDAFVRHTWQPLLEGTIWYDDIEKEDIPDWGHTCNSGGLDS